MEPLVDDLIYNAMPDPVVLINSQRKIFSVNPALVEDTLTFNDITMDLSSHQVSRADTKIHLGPKEYKILKTLLERPTRVLTRETLLDRVWGTNVYVEDRTIDVHIGRLRKALKVAGKDDPIRTVRGVGYALKE
jgi:two-component system, OmpR family, phosphate regulon response regulator PhoB